ncbi:hypothetical protein [Spiroplasma phoeniceum]|nr:hypothetical protein [Spiroplasma phoeniceum]
MALTTVEFSGKFDNIIQDILAKIKTDIIWLKECFTWLNQFDIMIV